MKWSKPYVTHTTTVRAIPNTDFVILMASVLQKGKPFRFCAAGFSMSPFIKDGDILTLIPASQPHLRLGAVAAIVSPLSAKLAVHRFIACQDDQCLFKGDNGTRPDGWVSNDDIIGVVTRVERAGKPIRFGGGWARGLIAWLSRHNILQFGLHTSYKIYSSLFKRKTHEQRQKN